MYHKRITIWVLMALSTITAQAQQTAFSLKEAVDYAIKNNESVKNALLDVQSADYKVKETITLGLPQINGAIQVAHSPKIQSFVLEYDPNSPFGGGPAQPGGPQVGDPIFLALSLKNSAQASITWNQLIFDGSYLVGLQAANTYRQLSTRSLLASKVTVAENVTKAYYGALINQNRIGLLTSSIARLDSSLKEANAYLKNGFAEQLDVNRLEVALNNLKVEKQKTERLVELSVNLLKFQMGYDIKQPIMLTDKVTDSDIANLSTDAGTGSFENRAEYKLLLTQQALNELDLKNVKAGYVPKLYGSFSAGSLTAASKFGNLTEFGSRWADYSQIGVQLQVPIFDSFQKYWQGQQKKVAIEKTRNNLEQFKRSVSLQTASASVSLENALATLQTQKRTLQLAEEVVRVTKAKFKQGIGSNLEVTTAEADLKDAQINYFNATLDALNAKVDLDVATGKLYSE